MIFGLIICDVFHSWSGLSVLANIGANSYCYEIAFIFGGSCSSLKTVRISMLKTPTFDHIASITSSYFM